MHTTERPNRTKRKGVYRRLIPALLAAVFGAAGVEVSRAQSSQATLQGRVASAATGQPLARALVIQRNLQTRAQSYRYTNDQGLYFFPALLPGMYSVRVDALGFQAEERSPVELPVASRIELNFDLQASAAPPGAPAAPATSAAPAPARASPANILSIMYGADAAVPQALLITLPIPGTETLAGSISSLIDERKILELPLSGRDVYTLLVLQPGVTSDNATARGLGFSVNGQRVASSNFLLDGVDNNDLLVTGPATRISAEAVQEYRMTTNNFTAEFGRASGFIANAITRSGGSALHGTAFEFFNHDRVNANSFSNNWQGLARPPGRQNQYGASLGGPLRRDRLFFFANAERLQSSGRSQPLDVFLPSPQFVASLREGSRAKELLRRFPPPPGEPIPGISFAVRHQFTLPFVQQNTFVLGRTDYNSPSGRYRLGARYAFSQQTSDDFLFSVYPDLNAPLVVRGQNFALTLVRDLAGGANELKLGLNRNSVRASRPQPNIPTMTSGEGIALPGSEAAYDYFFRDTVVHVIDNLNRLAGSHALGLGGEWRWGRHESLRSPARDGLYFFDSIFDFGADDPSLLLISLNRQNGRPAADSDYRRFYGLQEVAAFFQDNWKLARRLTLNLGMRWEYFGTPAARKTTRDSNFVFGPGRTIEERLASGRLGTGPLYRGDRNNFAPRIGFALDLIGNGESILRGGYGVFFDRIFNDIWLEVRSNALSLQTLTNFPGLPSQFEYSIPARLGVGPAAQLTPAATVAVDRALRAPYSQSWFLGLQQQLTPNLILEVDHAGAVGRKLVTADTINRPFSVRSSSSPVGRIHPSEPDISYRANQGTSDFAALEVGLNRRWSRGLQFQVAYTYSRSRDVQSDPLGRRASENQARAKRLADSSFFQIASAFTRQFDPQADYGLSDFDQTHNLVMNFVAEVPRSLRWGRILTGWQASGLLGFRSGFPFSVLSTAFDIPSSGGILIRNRADFQGKDSGEAFLPKRSPVPGGVVLLDKTKFDAPAPGRIGNTQRNAFRGPGFWNVDFALSRGFAVPRLGEGAWLQVRAEVFNLFNHTNLNNPDSILESPSLGEAAFGRQGFGSALPSVSPLNEQPRRIQFAVKFHF